MNSWIWQAILLIATSILVASLVHRVDSYRRELDQAKFDETIRVLRADLAHKESEMLALASQKRQMKEKIESYEAVLSSIRAARPQIKIVREQLRNKVTTDEGLQNEARRILGPLGLRELRVARVCQ